MKRILLILLAALWLVPGVAMAHSKLESAVPERDATVTASPERIEMTFNTKIEKLSNFKILNAAGEEMEKEKVEVDGMTMTGSVPAALPNGIYTVKWVIIGADGHSVEGDYSFTVEAPVVTEQPTQEPETTTATDKPAETAAPTPSPEASTNTDGGSSESATNDAGTNYTPYVIIGVIIVTAALLFMRRRK